MSILSVDTIQPIGSGSTVTLNAAKIVVGTGITFESNGQAIYAGIITARSGIRIGATGANTLIQGTATGIALGTGTPRQKLHINASDSGASNMVFTNTTTGTSAGDGFVVGITGGEDAQLNMQESANLKFSTADTERLRISSGGTVVIGDSSSATPTGKLHLYQASNDSYMYIQRGSGDSSLSIGGIFFKNSTNSLALIDVKSDDINDGHMKFSTMGAGTLTERLRITKDGAFGIGGANYGSSGQVLTSGGSGSAVQWATPAVTGGNMFIAKMNSGYITSNNTDGEIVFQNEVYDPDSRYNNSNGRFTPNVAGYYFIDASLQFSTNSANNNFESTIWKNGTEQFKNTMRNPASNSDIHCKVSGIVSVNGSSDYISIAAWQNSGGNITINPGNGSYFMGYFLRSL